jgi:hypothetical protein
MLSFLSSFKKLLKLPIENYVLDYFVIGVIMSVLICHFFASPCQTLRRPFADPSLKLKASAQGFGSGHRLTPFLSF